MGVRITSGSKETFARHLIAVGSIRIEEDTELLDSKGCVVIEVSCF
jgi:hypothetical protein